MNSLFVLVDSNSRILTIQSGEGTVELKQLPDIQKVLAYFSIDPINMVLPEISLYVEEIPDTGFVVIEKPNVVMMKQRRSQILSTLCSVQCTSGALSDALGEEHLYPTSLLDQQNLAASVTASYNPQNPSDWSVVIWCQKVSDGSWSLVDHDTLQVKQVGESVLRHVETQRKKLRDLQALLNAIPDDPVAENVTALAAISW